MSVDCYFCNAFEQMKKSCFSAGFLLLKISDKLFPNRIKAFTAKTEVHFLVAPCTSCNSVLFKNTVDTFKPLYCILRGADVNYAVFTAIKLCAILLGS